MLLIDNSYLYLVTTNPFLSNFTSFYIHTSDKCLCGIISSETESAECIRANRQGPDDDRVSIDCYGDASRVSIMGYTFDSSSSGSNGDDGGAGGGWVDGKGYTGHDDVLFTTYTVSKKGTDDYYIF